MMCYTEAIPEGTMKEISHPAFTYPGLGGGGRCKVEAYRLGPDVLVVLRDQDDHGGPSVTNALEQVCRGVRDELLAPKGLDRLETYWTHWSRVDGVASLVEFRDPLSLEGPQWQYLSPEEFARILEGFEAEDPLERWIREGALGVEGWEETRGEHARTIPFGTEQALCTDRTIPFGTACGCAPRARSPVGTGCARAPGGGPIRAGVG
ncbi:hypothetical protein, partial [Calidithermus terrae]|uniref:hypothetical protein n=1 Tax=Calidithermus terrae TaxID=1408545 RepID=UPI001FE76712